MKIKKHSFRFSRKNFKRCKSLQIRSKAMNGKMLKRELLKFRVKYGSANVTINVESSLKGLKIKKSVANNVEKSFMYFTAMVGLKRLTPLSYTYPKIGTKKTARGTVFFGRTPKSKAYRLLKIRGKRPKVRINFSRRLRVRNRGVHEKAGI